MRYSLAIFRMFPSHTHIELSFRFFVVKIFIFKCKPEFRYRKGIKLPPIYFVFRILLEFLDPCIHLIYMEITIMEKNQTLLKTLTIIPYIFLQLYYVHYDMALNDNTRSLYTHTHKFAKSLEKSPKIT